MGADMVTAGLVLVDGVELDWEAARKAVGELDENDVASGDWPFDDVEEMRGGLLADVEAAQAAFGGERGSRELDWFQVGPFRLYLTGGLSWGDSPTVLFDVFVRLDGYGIAEAAGFGDGAAATA